MSTVITLRLPDDLLEKIDKEIVPAKRKEKRVMNLSRNDVLLEAILDMCDKQAAQDKQ